jgi:hypothetical protein
MSDRIKWLMGVAVVSLLGAALVTPVTAHINNSVGHVWNDHLKGLATETFYTKAASNNRFLPSSNLPVGKTLRGVWGAIEKGNEAAWHVETYAQRLPADVAAHYIPSGTAAPSACPGSVTNAQARPGHLCIYEGVTQNIGSPPPPVCIFRAAQTANQCYQVTGRDGFGFAIFSTNEESQYFASGSWAVTAASSTPSITARVSARTLSGE